MTLETRQTIRTASTKSVFTEYQDSQRKATPSPVSMTIDKNVSSSEANTRVQHIIETVREVFNLTIAEVGNACHVGKRTPYNWLKDEKVINRKTKGMDRLFILYQAAMNWKEAGYKKVSKADHLIPVLDGSTLIDMLNSDTIDLDSISFIGSRLSLDNFDNVLSDPFE